MSSSNGDASALKVTVDAAEGTDKPSGVSVLPAAFAPMDEHLQTPDDGEVTEEFGNQRGPVTFHVTMKRKSGEAAGRGKDERSLEEVAREAGFGGGRGGGRGFSQTPDGRRQYRNPFLAEGMVTEESAESEEKRLARAKRFGIQGTSEDFSGAAEKKAALYAELGVPDPKAPPSKADVFTENKVRYDVLHIRGTRRMHTNDLFRHFAEFAPKAVEWVSDEAANLILPSQDTAAKLLLFAAKPLRRIGATNSTTVLSPLKRAAEKEAEEEAETEEKKAEEEEADVAEAEEVVEDDIVEEAAMEEDVVPEDPVGADVVAEEDGAIPVDVSKHTVPSGAWRVSTRRSELSPLLLLRFATAEDVKATGAQYRSRFYQEEGNPNHGGQRGLISLGKRHFRGDLRDNLGPPDLRGQLRGPGGAGGRQILQGRRRLGGRVVLPGGGWGRPRDREMLAAEGSDPEAEWTEHDDRELHYYDDLIERRRAELAALDAEKERKEAELGRMAGRLGSKSGGGAGLRMRMRADEESRRPRRRETEEDWSPDRVSRPRPPSREYETYYPDLRSRVGRAGRESRRERRRTAEEEADDAWAEEDVEIVEGQEVIREAFEPASKRRRRRSSHSESPPSPPRKGLASKAVPVSAPGNSPLKKMAGGGVKTQDAKWAPPKDIKKMKVTVDV